MHVARGGGGGIGFIIYVIGANLKVATKIN